jgi:chemotaxis response regulator CheB
MRTLQVLIVDDSALFRTMLQNVVREIPGTSVCGSVSNGDQAIEAVARLAPDVVTLDVEMPGLSGIDVLRELRRRRLACRVIMLSRLTAAGAQITTDALLEARSTLFSNHPVLHCSKTVSCSLMHSHRSSITSASCSPVTPPMAVVVDARRWRSCLPQPENSPRD